MVAWFKSPEGKWFKKEINDSDSPDAAVYEGLEHGPFHHVQLAVAYLASKDANFLFGTDTPSAPTYGTLPGLNGLSRDGTAAKSWDVARRLGNQDRQNLADC